MRLINHEDCAAYLCCSTAGRVAERAHDSDYRMPWTLIFIRVGKKYLLWRYPMLSAGKMGTS